MAWHRALTPATSQFNPQQRLSNTLTQNKKAYADYEILEKIEAGIVLTGAEVKSVRGAHAMLKGSFVEVSPRLEAFVRNIHISPYKMAPQEGYNPTKRRKLLLKKPEIMQLKNALDNKGFTVVPLDFHLSGNRIKLLIGVIVLFLISKFLPH